MWKRQILVVDDRREDLLTLDSLLNSPDLQLDRAESGNDAVAKILEYDFALILIDVRMSGMEGYATAELIRGIDRSSSIPIIFVTTTPVTPEHMFKGYDSGAVDYLCTPIEPQILRRKVSTFLELHHLRQQLEENTQELDGKILELEVLHNELEEKNEMLELLSSLDGLTGLFNRRYFDHNLIKEWKQASRDKTPLSLLIVDIDYLKNYNDYYGYLAGDDCLRKVGQLLYETLLRPTDIIARYGGEEFAAILPNTESEGAEKVAERMIDCVARSGIAHNGSPVAEIVTVSIGAYSIFPKEQIDVISLLDSAHRALSEAKEKSRNTFVAKVQHPKVNL
ncbi:MAG: diguanylate cyclase [Desulfobulbaceae bacterium]|nr:diguanylate cyclase [Desulfobulbaceae bacterium]